MTVFNRERGETAEMEDGVVEWRGLGIVTERGGLGERKGVRKKGEG